MSAFLLKAVGILALLHGPAGYGLHGEVQMLSESTFSTVRLNSETISGRGLYSNIEGSLIMTMASFVSIFAFLSKGKEKKKKRQCSLIKCMSTQH